MNRGEFLAELRAQLADFSEEAREDALKFYEEYLDEAGPENEAIVLAELGSPQKVARIIRANCDSGMPEAGPDTAHRAHRAARLTLDGPDWRAPRAPRPPRQPEQPAPGSADDAAPGQDTDGAAGGAGAFGAAGAAGGPGAAGANGAGGAAGTETGGARRPAYEYRYPANGGQGGAGGRDRTLWIILLVLTFPVWIGLLGGLIGGAFGLVGGLIGLFAGGIGTMIAGFAALGGGIGLLFSSAPSGILMIGISLLCVACGALLAAFSLWAVKVLIPLAVRAVRWLWNKLFGNGR